MELSDVRRERNVEPRLALLWAWIRGRAHSYPIFDDDGEIVGFSYIWSQDQAPSEDELAEAQMLALGAAVASMLGLTTIPSELDDPASVVVIDDVF